MFKRIKSPWYKYLIITLVGILLILINVFANNAWLLYAYYVDGVFIAGTVLLLLGGLSFVTSQGAFDIFSYMGTKRNKSGRKLTLSEYSEALQIERKQKGLVFMPYIIVGFCFILIGLVLLIWMT